MKEIPTTQLYMQTVLDRSPCGKHSVPAGMPCWSLSRMAFGFSSAVCDRRARKAGFVGYIKPKSLQRR